MSSSTAVVRKRGPILIKEAGIRSFMWSKRFLQLRDQMVTIHKNDITYQALQVILLKDVESVQRTDLKAYCFEIATKNKTFQLACENDSDLYSWIEEIYTVKID
jgi:protein-serine/threonine kinase